MCVCVCVRMCLYPSLVLSTLSYVRTGHKILFGRTYAHVGAVAEEENNHAAVVRAYEEAGRFLPRFVCLSFSLPLFLSALN